MPGRVSYPPLDREQAVVFLTPRESNTKWSQSRGLVQPHAGKHVYTAVRYIPFSSHILGLLTLRGHCRPEASSFTQPSYIHKGLALLASQYLTYCYSEILLLYQDIDRQCVSQSPPLSSQQPSLSPLRLFPAGEIWNRLSSYLRGNMTMNAIMNAFARFVFAVPSSFELVANKPLPCCKGGNIVYCSG
jgi:hypothetical protein